MMPSEKRPVDKRLLKLPNNEYLPSPVNGSCLVLGSAGRGKTSWIWSFFSKFFPNYFDEVIIFCATKDSADTWAKMPQRHVVVLHHYSDEILDAYIKDLQEEQLKRQAEGKFPLRCCVMLDDMAGSKITNISKPTSVDRLALNCRHYNIFLMISSQRFRLISNTMRQNTHYVVLYKMNKADMEKVAEEFSDPLPEDQFLKIANDICDVPYNYLFIDLRAKPEDRFREQMDNILPIKQLLEL